MLSKKYKISKKLFEEVFVKGKSVKTDFFLLKYKNNEEKTSRVSVVASKKIFKTAVSRNKIKRKFKSILKETRLINSKRDLIFILNKNTEAVDRNELILIIDQIRLK
jgi:ribonuclease P protein component